MAHPRRFRFGVQMSNTVDGKSWAETARRIEGLGFSSLFLPDHFTPQLAPIPAMMAAADATTELRVGALVLDNDYRHPVVLAKELATIDLLSDGRLEIGLGAGWMRTDYEQAGIPYDRPGVRIDRFEEGLAIVKGLFAEGPLSYQGRHYTVSALEGMPKPIQRPHPPFLIGAGGERMLSIAAREADIVGVNPSLTSGQVDATTASDATADAYDRKVATLRAAAGDRFDELELNCLLFFVAQTDDRQALAANLAPMFGLSPEQVLEAPIALIGTVDEMCETLEARRERWGLSYFVCQADAVDTFAPVVSRLAGT
ncbi:MAG: TIGR03621 family F420-dependent LLM class oxidoreductase [Acidimicrobiales bacterium]|nr:TIGR03621 family F420-dependent LLM class oxidoreductase [Acidimicrobiales bacterium]